MGCPMGRTSPPRELGGPKGTHRGEPSQEESRDPKGVLRVGITWPLDSNRACNRDGITGYRVRNYNRVLRVRNCNRGRGGAPGTPGDPGDPRADFWQFFVLIFDTNSIKKSTPEVFEYLAPGTPLFRSKSVPVYRIFCKKKIPY